MSSGTPVSGAMEPKRGASPLRHRLYVVIFESDTGACRALGNAAAGARRACPGCREPEPDPRARFCRFCATAFPSDVPAPAAPPAEPAGATADP